MSSELKPCPHCGSKRVFAWPSLVLCVECCAVVAGNSREDSSAKWNRRTVTREQVEAAAKALGVELELRHPDEREYLRNIATVAFRASGFEVQS